MSTTIPIQNKLDVPGEAVGNDISESINWEFSRDKGHKEKLDRQ